MQSFEEMEAELGIEEELRRILLAAWIIFVSCMAGIVLLAIYFFMGSTPEQVSDRQFLEYWLASIALMVIAWIPYRLVKAHFLSVLSNWWKSRKGM